MYQPNEAGTLSVKLNILKDTDNKSLDFVDSFFLAHDLRGNFNACCFLEAHGANQIKVKSKVGSLNFEKVLTTNE